MAKGKRRNPRSKVVKHKGKRRVSAEKKAQKNITDQMISFMIM